ncbi:hypothetical protein ACFZC5_34705 [Nocardia gamkensis]|uniref:hypothetical protein n=1 Tax=Nocardia gamkensis TaxID=352869 RepID=UPI0036E23C2F
MAEKLAKRDIPDAGRAAEIPIRQIKEPMTEYVGNTTDRDLDARAQIARAGFGESSQGTPAPLDPSPRSVAVFSPDMSGQQIHQTVAGLLRDHGAAGTSSKLPGLAALPVNYGLTGSGKEGVHLRLTKEHTDAGSVVSGWVEGVPPAVDRSGMLADNFFGEKFGEFTWKDPGDGTDPSWSMRLITNRKRIDRADSLPDQLASLAPDFGVDQVRSTVTDAMELASRHKALRRGYATLAAESAGEQLRVRVFRGGLPADITPPDWVLFDRTISRD